MEQKNQQTKFSLCAIKGIQELENCLENSRLERSLLELVKLRTSQIYECDHCKDMHTRDARTTGHTLQRLFALKNWREAADFNEREKAALIWTEAITSSSRQTAVDAVYNEVRKHFEEEELVVLTMAVNVVDSWNRLSFTRSSEDLSALSDESNLAN